MCLQSVPSLVKACSRKWSLGRVPKSADDCSPRSPVTSVEKKTVTEILPLPWSEPRTNSCRSRPTNWSQWHKPFLTPPYVEAKTTFMEQFDIACRVNESEELGPSNEKVSFGEEDDDDCLVVGTEKEMCESASLWPRTGWSAVPSWSCAIQQSSCHPRGWHRF